MMIACKNEQRYSINIISKNCGGKICLKRNIFDCKTHPRLIVKRGER